MAKYLDKLFVGPEKMEVLDGHEGFFAGGEPTSDLLGDPYRHSVLGLFVAKPGEERIVFATAQHHQLLAGLCLEKLRLHEQHTLPVNISTVSDGSDLESITVLDQNDSVVALSHSKVDGTDHRLDVARTGNAVSIERRQDTLLNRGGQFAARLGGRHREYERLAHVGSIVASVTARKRTIAPERSVG
jgi:hypothetical protein